ncbi:MAG: polyprenyl synthetase family protein [Candidatus Omnitrophica bacterium]|nr:polyprenyl synthetase family protein [Candidatus Omnitrophota bacterium]
MKTQTKTLERIYSPIRSELKAADTLLARELSAGAGLMGELTRYVARMQGKRIRPALALLSARLIAGGRNGASGLGREPIALAVAVELIHTATLLHDDVIDGASLRRGLSTLNAKWGNTLSVLSGDYLYSKAFCLLSSLESPGVLKLMSETARILCEGEVAQIHHQYNTALSRAQYLKIIGAKTASLMSACAQAGALLAGATPRQALRLSRFGLQFGLAFQVLDDTQDLVGDEAALGKSLGTDAALGNITLPLIALMESGAADVSKRLSAWYGNGHSPAAEAELLTLLREEVIRRKIPQACRRLAGRFLDRSREALEPFPDSPAKESLLALADYLL